MRGGRIHQAKGKTRKKKVSQPPNRRNVEKCARSEFCIMEVEKLQIAADDQKNPARGRAAAGMPKKLMTKAVQHKGPDGNVARRKEAETSGGRRKQGGDTKAIDLLTTVWYTAMFS